MALAVRSLTGVERTMVFFTVLLAYDFLYLLSGSYVSYAVVWY
jgi:hypothetical protein